MRWPKRSKAYSTDTSKVVLTTPYEKAAGVWDHRIGTARVQARNWRLLALMAMLVSFVAVGGLIYSYMHRPFHVHVVEINPKGEPGKIVLADESYSPNDAQLAYLIAQLVELVRSRPLDPVVLRNNWEKAYYFLAGEAIGTMNAYARDNSGLNTPGGQLLARVVEITSVLQRSENSFQVQWIEIEFVGGNIQTQEAYTGLFHITLDPPEDEAELLRNPLGVYVVNFHWARDFTAVTHDEEVQAHEPLTNTDTE